MAGQRDQSKPISLFYSYSHKDEDLRLKLETHLAALRRGGLIAEWHDRKIVAGDAWKEQIDRHLTSADIIVLLVSSDFIASDYCWGEEMTKALQRHERGVARVIPVILRQCRWQSTPLKKLQAVPRGAKPIKSWADKDKAFDDVAAEIERAVEAVRLRAEEELRRRPEEQPQKSEAATGEPTRVRSPSWERGDVFRDIEAPWCPELVVVPAGRFRMGSPDDEEGRGSDEGPRHRVTFAQPFALGRYPVTFEEYDYFCRQVGRERPADEGWRRGRRPVINVSWDDAGAYCAWLSEQTGQRYRLPSEAEWEYACRAGTTTPFWTGMIISTDQANYDGRNTYGLGRQGKFRRKTTAVDRFEANGWGLHDMHGNVWEWCLDYWHRSYHEAPKDGSAWLKGGSAGRVVRGGSWHTKSWNIRAASRRDRIDPSSHRGFRVARTV